MRIVVTAKVSPTGDYTLKAELDTDGGPMELTYAHVSQLETGGLSQYEVQTVCELVALSVRSRLLEMFKAAEVIKQEVRHV